MPILTAAHHPDDHDPDFVEVDPAEDWRPWRGTCSCGWEGEPRGSATMARSDADWHATMAYYPQTGATP